MQALRTDMQDSLKDWNPMQEFESDNDIKRLNLRDLTLS